MKRSWKEFTKGFISQNALFVICLGNCPALMMSIALDSSIGMSVGLAFVMFGTSIVISGMRNFIPNVVRIPIMIVTAASFVTIVDLVFHAYVPAVWVLLGIYLPLITVNCNVLGRAEVFALRNPVLPSVADGVGIALGFGLAMLVVAIPRQLFGTGSLSLMGKDFLTLPVLDKQPIGMLVQPQGAFLVIGLLHGLFRRVGIEKHE